jgi:hypothetical protein
MILTFHPLPTPPIPNLELVLETLANSHRSLSVCGWRLWVEECFNLNLANYPLDCYLSLENLIIFSGGGVICGIAMPMPPDMRVDMAEAREAALISVVKPQFQHLTVQLVNKKAGPEPGWRYVLDLRTVNKWLAPQPAPPRPRDD